MSSFPKCHYESKFWTENYKGWNTFNSTGLCPALSKMQKGHFSAWFKLKVDEAWVNSLSDKGEHDIFYGMKVQTLQFYLVTLAWLQQYLQLSKEASKSCESRPLECGLKGSWKWLDKSLTCLTLVMHYSNPPEVCGLVSLKVSSGGHSISNSFFLCISCASLQRMY